MSIWEMPPKKHLYQLRCDWKPGGSSLAPYFEGVLDISSSKSLPSKHQLVKTPISSTFFLKSDLWMSIPNNQNSDEKVQYCQGLGGFTLPKTNMVMENGPFEDVFPIEYRDFPC